jgi:FkbM family methyltransferase
MPRLRPIGTVAFLAAWLIPWKPVFRTRAAESGLVFHVHRRDVSGRHIAKYGTREPDLTHWIDTWLAQCPSGLFVDVGANVGWHVLHAARLPSVETVVAFEPDPFNLYLIECNLEANKIDKAIVIAAAVGAQRGTVRLHRYKASNSGRHSALTDYGYGSRTVPLLDLDGALDDLGLADRPINVLKIDVEGYEPAVIRGATRTLARTAAVVLEFSPVLSRAGGLSTDELLDLLQSIGFVPFAIKNAGRLEPLDVKMLRQMNGQTDVVFLKNPNGVPPSRNLARA